MYSLDRHALGSRVCAHTELHSHTIRGDATNELDRATNDFIVLARFALSCKPAPRRRSHFDPEVCVCSQSALYRALVCGAMVHTDTLHTCRLQQ